MLEKIEIQVKTGQPAEKLRRGMTFMVIVA
jgi:hypothetical protein